MSLNNCVSETTIIWVCSPYITEITLLSATAGRLWMNAGILGIPANRMNLIQSKIDIFTPARSGALRLSRGVIGLPIGWYIKS